MRMFGSDANDPEDSEGYNATVRARLGNDKELKIPVVDNESYMKAAHHHGLNVLSSNAGGGYARACRSCLNLHPINILVCPATGKSVVTGEPLSFGAGIEGGCVAPKKKEMSDVDNVYKERALDLRTEFLIVGKNKHSVYHICPTHGTGCWKPLECDCPDCILYLSGADVRTLIDEARRQK